jgi:arylformamidase
MNLEAEYDNRGKVPEFQAILDRWTHEAAAFRGSWPQAELDLVYGPSERQALDIFWPDAEREGPMVIFVHGGYWRMLDRTRFSHLARGLLAHGVAVAMPSYDLCPAVTLAELVEEVRASAAFVGRRHGRRMLAMGHSAGGHLAAMLLATDWVAHGVRADLIPAALPVSGLFDLDPLRHTTVNDAIRLDEAEAHRLSPVHLPRPAGRLHAIVGGTEGVEYTRQSRSIAEAWGGTWEAVPGANHFTVIDAMQQPDSAMVRTALELLPS